jgi:hypothetical protein
MILFRSWPHLSGPRSPHCTDTLFDLADKESLSTIMPPNVGHQRNETS